MYLWILRLDFYFYLPIQTTDTSPNNIVLCEAAGFVLSSNLQLMGTLTVVGCV